MPEDDVQEGAEAACFGRLTLDVQARIVRCVSDASGRASLRAASPTLRALVAASSVELRFGPGADEIRHVAARCAMWRCVRRLQLRGAARAGPLADLLAALDMHCSELSELRAALPAPSARPLLSAIAAGQLARLASLTLTSPFGAGPRLRLDPLSALTALRDLALDAPVDNESEGQWLPRSLRRLSVASCRAPGIPGCGAAWAAAVGGCCQLEELELKNLGAADFQRAEGGLPTVLGQLTSLTGLTGVLRSLPNREVRPLLASDLLQRLPRLRRLALYLLIVEPMVSDGGELRPALIGSFQEVAESAHGGLEELVVCFYPPEGYEDELEDGPGYQSLSLLGPPPLLPSLTTLHATAQEPGAYPRDVAAAFPRLRYGIFGDGCSSAPVVLPPLAGLGACLSLERLCLVAGEWGACMGGSFSELRLAGCLKDLELFDFRRAEEGADVLDPPAELHPHELWEAASSPPQLARLAVSSPPGSSPPGFLGALGGGAPSGSGGGAGRPWSGRMVWRRAGDADGEGLELVVRDAQPQPCLLTASDFGIV